MELDQGRRQPRAAQKGERRLLIPVYDLDGKLVTFQGRDIIGDQDAKYLFPPALPGTGRFLYNGHNAVRARRIAMGEGAFDVFSLKAAIDGESDLRDIVPGRLVRQAPLHRRPRGP